jgi:hypothetical protein
MSTCLLALSLEEENNRLFDYETAAKAQKANNPKLARQYSVSLLRSALRTETSGVVVKQAYARTSQVDNDSRLRTLAGIITRREIIQSCQWGFATGTNRKLPGRTAGARVGFARKRMCSGGQAEYCTAHNNEPELNMLDFIANNTIGFTGDTRYVRETRSLWFRSFVIVHFHKIPSIFRDWFRWNGVRPLAWWVRCPPPPISRYCADNSVFS